MQKVVEPIYFCSIEKRLWSYKCSHYFRKKNCVLKTTTFKCICELLPDGLSFFSRKVQISETTFFFIKILMVSVTQWGFFPHFYESENPLHKLPITEHIGGRINTLVGRINSFVSRVSSLVGRISHWLAGSTHWWAGSTHWRAGSTHLWAGSAHWWAGSLIGWQGQDIGGHGQHIGWQGQLIGMQGQHISRQGQHIGRQGQHIGWLG